MTLEDYPIDDDYVDVEKRTVKISEVDAEEDPPIDRSPSSADRSHIFRQEESFSDEVDQTSPNATIPVGPEQASESQTVFNPYENNNNPEKWKRLRRWQGDYRSKHRSSQNAKADHRSYVVTFGSQLELTSHQKERCLQVVSDLELNKFGSHSAEIVILSVITLVANKDARWIRDEATFRRLLFDIDSSLQDVRKVRNMIRQYVSI